MINVNCFCLSDKEKIQMSIINTKIMTPEELLNAYVTALYRGLEDVANVYKSVILNKLHDSEILYNILENIED